MKTYLHLACAPVDAHRISVSTIYRRSGIEKMLPFAASNGVTLATDAAGETRVGQLTNNRLVVLIRNDHCRPAAWHKPAIALVADSKAAAKAIKTAVREFRTKLNQPVRA